MSVTCLLWPTHAPLHADALMPCQSAALRIGAHLNVQVIQHGACLGLGIAALGTCDEEAFEDVKNVLYMDNAGEGSPGCC